MGLVVPMVFNHFQSNSISIWHSSGELRQICKGKSGRKDFKMVHPFPWGATESRCSSHAHIVQNPWDIRCRVWYLEEYIWWWIRGSGYQIWDPPYFEHQLLDIRLEILYVHPRRPPRPSPALQFQVWRIDLDWSCKYNIKTLIRNSKLWRKAIRAWDFDQLWKFRKLKAAWCQTKLGL